MEGEVGWKQFSSYIRLNINSRNDALKTCKAILRDILSGEFHCTTTSVLRRYFMFSRKIWRSRRSIVKLRQAGLLEGPKTFVIGNDSIKRCNMIILRRSSGPQKLLFIRILATRYHK